MPGDGVATVGLGTQNDKQTLWQWMPEFLRHELAPYPGRWSLVARMVIAATVSMLIIVTFRIPYGAIGVNCAFILSRENLTATAKSGFYFILAFAVWAALTPVGARMFASVPMTHFLWEGFTAFLCFFLLKTLTNFPLAAGAVVVATGTMAIWYLPGPAEQNVELTLWQILATAIGALVTFLVEVVFRQFSTKDFLLDGIDDRLRSMETMLRGWGDDIPLAVAVINPITQYAITGAGALREQIARRHSTSAERVKMNALVALVGQCIDLSAALASSRGLFDPSMKERAKILAAKIGTIRDVLRGSARPIADSSPHAWQSSGDYLSRLEAALSLIESVMVTGKADVVESTRADDSEELRRLFVRDAFTNPDYVKYALAGTATAMLCYVIYVSLDWPGISTAVTTCVLTALSNIGASRQKQLLRIIGALIGGFVLGVGSQIFVLPYIDSIAGFTVLLAVVTGISAYVATSSPRLSYVGLQMAFAFYLINVTDFSVSMDLTIGRDRAVGVLLGITVMWLVFDRLYSRPAGIEMVSGFARSARLVADLTQMVEGGVEERELVKVQIIRDQVSSLFASVNAEADAVPFEGGDRRASSLAARGRVRRWLAVLRTIYVLELPILHDRLVRDPDQAAHEHREISEQSYETFSTSLCRIANCLEGQLHADLRKCVRYEASPGASELPESAERDRGLVASDRQSEPLQQISSLVNELERDVFKQPVFQP